MQPVDVETRGEVAILWIDNPPVNALGFHLRARLADTVRGLQDEAGIVGLVLASRGRVFIAGADIREFDQTPKPPSLIEVLDCFDGSGKPIVAAIDGAALGGGLEVALACDERIVTSRARLGLPEVKLGLLPGAGGTQRLPLAIGPVEALAMIADGEPRSGEAAKALGLADRLVESDELLEVAAARARALAGGSGRKRLRDVSLGPDELPALETAADELLGSRGGEPQIRAMVECVRNRFDLGFDEGMRRERQHFLRLLEGDRSKAMRHAFLAERRSAFKSTGVPAAAVRRVAVIGGGTMGSGIAMSFANAGIPATIVEADEAAAARAASRVAETYERSVRRGSLDESARAERIGRIEALVGIEAAAEADLVIEAVFEDMDVKKQVFAWLDTSARSDAVLATNTSYLDVDAIAASAGRPERVLGMHFFSPANVMKLVEVVRGKATSEAALATAVEVARRIGKIPVVVGVCHGFVGNRMLSRRSEQVDRLLLEGALPDQVDRVLADFGFRMGPCAMSDLAGLDIGWRMRRATGKAAPVADALVEAGRLGQKTRKGYYDYPDGRKAVVDGRVEMLLREVSERAGIARRAVGQQEILDRLLLPMINEGARILEEGVAARAGDIDVIWLHGYGFPRWRGGPMYHADRIGLDEVARRLSSYAEATADAALRPAPLLKQLAEEKRGFASLAPEHKE
jgi:3-hydroxyacyl-CoA dehydrogenase